MHIKIAVTSYPPVRVHDDKIKHVCIDLLYLISILKYFQNISYFPFTTTLSRDINIYILIWIIDYE